MATLAYPVDFFSRPPKTPIPGARFDYRLYTPTVAELALTTLYICMGILPAGCRLFTAALEVAGSAAASGLTISVGMLNTYYNAPDNGQIATAAHPATYNSGGATDTGTTAALVSGQNIFTSATIGVAGGMTVMGSQGAASGTATIFPFSAIGVDQFKDRILAMYFPVAATTPVSVAFRLLLGFDQD
jgi:hypothetical protein